ncbi:hypothetical protein [Rhizobium sp. TH135]|uniref:hypothetical protein n=1 Tax=Rhizobium sp. TH135 TaxID=2067451 RepID=UPI00117CC558|nr:hypothetical protein [Rhizobium sp. TH135]
MSYLNDGHLGWTHKARLTEGSPMNTSPPRVLIAENQYLIAMEVERILQESLVCDVKITPVSGLANELSAGEFDIVIIDAASSEPLNVERATLVLSAGALPVFLSSYDHFPDAGTIVSSYPILSKPPQADELAAAVIDAMRRKWLNSEGLLDDR